MTCLTAAAILVLFIVSLSSPDAPAQAPAWAKYLTQADGRIIAIDAEGNVYYGGWLEGEIFSPAQPAGSFREGITAAEGSSWGSIKKMGKF